MTRFLVTFFSLMTPVLLAGSAAAQTRINLRAEATSNNDQVLLGDIADITDGPVQARAQLRQLPIATFKPDQQSVTLRQSLIAIHLRLTGWSANQFRLSGTDRVLVRRTTAEAVSDMAIEAAASATIQATLNLPADELRIRLTSPYTDSLPGVLQKDDSLTVKVLPPLNSRLGSMPLTVQLWQGTRLVHSRAGRFDVLRRHQVVVTRTSLPRGHIITEQDVQAEVRFLASPTDQFELGQVVGQKARTNVPTGTIVSRRHLQPAADPRKEQVIRQRDSVHVIAVNGPLRVKLNFAEALQSGRQGDTIRVRNLNSNEVISGKVTGPGRVEIRL